jgi:DNA-cytosine methyltransferase
MSHVDTTSPVTHISLCAGYGGIDLGLNRAVGNLRTIAFSEIEAFACANLVSKMEAGLLDCAPIWTNLKTFPWSEFRDRVDILSGGFPCQPFSCAGKRDGDEDPRHLFPYILDGIGRCRPSIVFLENVEGILSAKLTGDNWRDPAGTPVLLHVFRELERVGYKATAGIFSASEVGAPHQRKRVFILAYDNNKRLEGLNQWNASPKSPETLGANFGASGFSNMGNPVNNDGINVSRNKLGDEEQSLISNSSIMADALCNGSGEGREVRQGPDGSIAFSNGESWGAWPSRPGQPQFSWEPPRVVGDSSHKRKLNEAEQDLSEAGTLLDRASEGSGMENSKQLGRRGRDYGDEGGNCGEIQTAGSCGGWSEDRKTQPSVGGDPYGTPRGMGHAELCQPDHAAGRGESGLPGGQLDDTRGTELHGIPDQQWPEVPASWEPSHPGLYVSCDNRTDELRLLGNGVVPATAELAFRTLWEELTCQP